jgi:glycosyltransferase involved in cell wall biosynthesis
MHVLISLEERFKRTPDGAVWSDSTFFYSFWKRYLEVFDKVRVMARVADAVTRQESWKRADGENVAFVALPYYVGPIAYAKRFLSIGRAIRRELRRQDALIMRVPSPIAHRVQRELPRHYPFGVEVVGDPYDVFAPGVSKHPIRPFLRRLMTTLLKNECRQACAVGYVTSGALQNRYPASDSAFSTIYSSVELRDEAYSAQPRNFGPRNHPIRIISVGTLEVLYKGFDVLIDAVSACIKGGLEVDLVIVGDGRCRLELQKSAQFCGIEHQVRFAGRIPAGYAVRKELDSADLFVLASRSEGLPRAMLEAMARGLPCIGSKVGGVPELLPADDLVPPGDLASLAAKIREVASNPDRMTRMSAANLAKARDYHDALLTCRRRELFTHVRQVTEQWKRTHESLATRPEHLHREDRSLVPR